MTQLLVLTSVLLAVCSVEAFRYEVAGVKYLEGLSEIAGLRGLTKRAPNVALSFKAHNRFYCYQVKRKLTEKLREFTLDLVPHESPFNEQSVFTYVEKGQAKTFDVDTSVYYSGTAKFGEEGTALVRIDTDSNTITGMIHGRQESFGIETTRHLSNATLKQHPMMIYKLSDIDSSEEACGVKAEEIPKVPSLLNQVNTMTKRQASTVCTMAVAADYWFYTSLNSDKFQVANRIMDIFTAADSLFKAQDIAGLQLVHTVIYTDTASDPFYATNAADDKLTFLNALRDNVGPTLPPTGKCVNHALTHRSWGFVVGYAYTGSICKNNVGGTSVGTTLSLGKPRPLSLTILSTTHEIGHNFGAPHDTSGKLIMAPSGGVDSIFEFSQASMTAIASTMSAKTCFINNAPFAYCGNGLIDDGEECDCGTSCPSTYCNGDCTLKPGYQCQPSNGACCAANGQFKAAGTICGSKSYGFIPEPTCSGNSALCPNCYPAGLHPCDAYSNLEPCHCPDNECGACCKRNDKPDASCYPANYWDLEMYMADGVCCNSNGTVGVCQSGYCRNNAGDIIDAANPNADNNDDSNSVSAAPGTVVNAILTLLGLALYYLQ